jgi:hypothetical protein
VGLFIKQRSGILLFNNDLPTFLVLFRTCMSDRRINIYTFDPGGIPNIVRHSNSFQILMIKKSDLLTRNESALMLKNMSEEIYQIYSNILCQGLSIKKIPQ